MAAAWAVHSLDLQSDKCTTHSDFRLDDDFDPRIWSNNGLKTKISSKSRTKPTWFPGTVQKEFLSTTETQILQANCRTTLIQILQVSGKKNPDYWDSSFGMTFYKTYPKQRWTTNWRQLILEVNLSPHSYVLELSQGDIYLTLTLTRHALPQTTFQFMSLKQLANRSKQNWWNI